MLLVTQERFYSIVVDGEILVSEGDFIEFVSEITGEIVKGILIKFNDKKADKMVIAQEGEENEIIWRKENIKEGSLKVLRSFINLQGE